MAFDTFDEGVNYGGIRSKNEIRTLICYLFKSVGKPMDKATVTEAIQSRALANYFETSSCFDDLIIHNNIELVDNENSLYFLTDNGKMIAAQLDYTLPPSVKEKAYNCAVSLLEQKRIEKENSVTITKTDMGYNVNCRVSGGNVDLISIDIYAPDRQQARIIKKNFHKNPELLYKTIMGTMSDDKELVHECLKESEARLRRKD